MVWSIGNFRVSCGKATFESLQPAVRTECILRIETSWLKFRPFDANWKAALPAVIRFASSWMLSSQPNRILFSGLFFDGEKFSSSSSGVGSKCHSDKFVNKPQVILANNNIATKQVFCRRAAKKNQFTLLGFNTGIEAVKEQNLTGPVHEVPKWNSRSRWSTCNRNNVLRCSRCFSHSRIALSD